jgi:predicted GIY-YIG superfamily endonuclease
MSNLGKRFVYVLRSESDPDRRYVGLTSDIRQRLEWHNHGPDGQTTRYRPWSIHVLIEFTDEETAVRFEKYLKSGSGRAFAKRHFSMNS